MTKLIVFAAVLVALLAFDRASGFTITTTVDEEEMDSDNQQIQKKCQRQIQQYYRQLHRCRDYLESQRGPSDEMDMDTDTDTDTVIQQYGNPGQQQSLNECCQGLRRLQGNRCRCDFIRDAVYVVQKGRPWGVGESLRLRQAAKLLPQRCQVGPRECQV